MKLLQELLEALNGSQRAAMKLGRNTGLAGKPIAKQETIEKRIGPDAWVPYSEGYKEGKRTFDKNNKGRRGTDKSKENLEEGLADVDAAVMSELEHSYKKKAVAAEKAEGTSKDTTEYKKFRESKVYKLVMGFIDWN